RTFSVPRIRERGGGTPRRLRGRNQKGVNCWAHRQFTPRFERRGRSAMDAAASRRRLRRSNQTFRRRRTNRNSLRVAVRCVAPPPGPVHGTTAPVDMTEAATIVHAASTIVRAAVPVENTNAQAARTIGLAERARALVS